MGEKKNHPQITPISDKLQLVGVRSVFLHDANLTLNRQAKAYRTSARNLRMVSSDELEVACQVRRRLRSIGWLFRQGMHDCVRDSSGD